MKSSAFNILLSFCLVTLLAGCPPKPHIVIPPETVNPPVKADKLQPILRLDTGGHTSVINDLIVTSDRKHLISCSDDKTIRVWDTETQKETRKILGEIGKGPFGQIFAIALSPDDRYLAVGGFLDTGPFSERVRIRIYHFPTGELIRNLKSHNDVVLDLVFSPDGRYLVSGSFDTTVKIWDVGDEFKMIHTFSKHSDFVYAVGIFRYKGDYRVVSAADDHKVFLYSLNRKAVLASFIRDDMADFLAISPEYIVCSGFNDHKINIFNLNLTHIKTIESETIPTGLAFSPDGKLLLAGTGANPLNCNIYNTEQNFRKIQSFPKHDNLTRAVAFLDNRTAITGGGDNYDIWFWDPLSGKTKGHIVGKGKRIWSVGAKSGEIAFGNTANSIENNNYGPLEKAFSLSDFKPLPSVDFSEFKRIPTRYRDYALSHTKGGQYGYSDGVLLVKKGGEIVSRIQRDSTNGVRHRCYGFTPDGLILSGGSNGQLKAYNTNGREIADFAGHTGEVWALALDGDRLVSAGDDMVIHAWDLKKLGQGRSRIFPSFSLFVSNDDQWVVWTPEGFFNASEKGAQFIGYHINRGKEKAAEYIGVDQVYDLFYRADLVAKRIQGGHEAEIQKELARIGDIDTIIRSGLPPGIQFIDAPDGLLTHRNLTLNLKLLKKSGGIGRVVFRVNGAQIDTPEGSRPIGDTGMKRRFTLDNGTHTITATAYNKDGNIESKPVSIRVRVEDPMNAKPDLQGLCIGISKYREGDLRLKYAADDALAMQKKIENRAAPLFRKVQIRSLTDRQATRKGIRAAFAKIAETIRPNDVFLLYMAGHGKAVRADYYFIPWEMRYENEQSIEQQGLSNKEIEALLATIHTSKSLIILDTCYAGFAAAPTLALARGLGEKKALERLMRATGRHTLAASSGVAYEQNGHGIYTNALLEGLSKGADQKGNGNGATGVDELADYVGTVVRETTFQRFGYEMVPMRSLSGDPFDIGCREGYDGPGCRP